MSDLFDFAWILRTLDTSVNILVTGVFLMVALEIDMHIVRG